MIDTHAHLTDKAFYDIDETVKAALNAGVTKIFVIGYDLQSSKKAIELAEKFKELYAVIGVHPTDGGAFNNETKNFLINNASHSKVIAIGEIGLDYHYEDSVGIKLLQKQIFVEQLKIANEANLPVVIHNRDSIGDMLNILNENKHLLNNGILMHCFSESYESYKQLKKTFLNVKISLGGVVTFKNAVNIKLVADKVPLEDIMLETDCPYLTPDPFRGKTNQPAYVKLVAEKIAKIKNISFDEVVKITDKNAISFFKKVDGNEQH